MLVNYLKVLIRSLFKQKVISLINLLGLAIGIALSILIFQYLHYEFTFDGFHHRSEDIYLANRQDVREGRDPFYNNFHNTSTNFAGSVETTIPEIEMAVRVTDGESIVRIENEVFEHYVHFVDGAFFDLFNFPLIEGDQSSAFKNKNSIVLTQSLVDRYFPNESPIGKMMEIEIWGNFSEYTVSAVVEDLPENTRFKADFFFPFQIIEDYYGNIYGDLWNLGFSQTYLRLSKNSDPMFIENKILKVMDDLGITTYWGKFGTQYYHIQPLSDVHLTLKNDRGFPTDTTSFGSIILICVGVIILLIAIINYTTLSAGKSNIRWREIGVRKVLGAGKRNLRVQFWFETILLVFISILLGFGLSEILLPTFNSLSGVQISNFGQTDFIVFLCILAFVLILSVGFYPVNILTSFPIHVVFRGSFKIGSKGVIRRALVFIQFTLSTSLIVATIVMSQQLSFIQNANLGFDKEQLLEVHIPNQDETGLKTLDLIRTRLDGQSDITEISGAACSMGSSWIRYEWNHETQQYKDIYANTVDYNYLKTMDIHLLRGRDFSSEQPSDAQRALIVNEAFVERMGWVNGIGETIPGSLEERDIIGVVQDYSFLTMHNNISPMILSINPSHMGELPERRKRQTNPTTIQRLYFRIAPGKIPSSIQQIENVWKEIVPDVPFDYSFMDEIVDREYKNDQRWRHVIMYSSILAILLAAFGLLGHTMMQVSQKMKEIGIRKVLGASSANIIKMLGSEITWIVILSNLIAWPLTYFGMKRWLDYFAYRIDMSITPFILATLLVLSIALLTTGTLAYRASSVNPVKGLRQD